MTSLVMFSRINEPLLTKLKEEYPGVDLDWITSQSTRVSALQNNVVRADQKDQTPISLLVFPMSYHVETPERCKDPRYLAWVTETKAKSVKQCFAHDQVSLYVY